MANRTKDGDYRLVLSDNGGDGASDHPWGQPVEVDLEELGPRRNIRWSDLSEELKLRLERTGPGKAVAVPIPGPGDLRRARQAIHYWFRVHCGRQAVLITARAKPDGSGVLYVRQGPNWK
jgi:hypothetical protein